MIRSLPSDGRSSCLLTCALGKAGISKNGHLQILIELSVFKKSPEVFPLTAALLVALLICGIESAGISINIKKLKKCQSLSMCTGDD